MPRSLYSAINGLTSHQQRMDVIADNIANVNTTSFKNSRMNFVASFSQVLRPPSNSQPNGIVIGLGNQISTVNTDFSQGAFQRTGVPTDVGIAGEGFFVVQDPTGSNLLTRDGAFIIDKDDFLINALGYNVRGVVYTDVATPGPDVAAVDPGNGAPAAVGDITIPKTFDGGSGLNTVLSYSINTDGAITVFGSLGDSLVVAYMTIAKFNAPQALNKIGNNLFTFNDAAGSFSGGSSFSATADVRKAGTNGFGQTQQGVLELSNVELAAEFTDMIVTQRGFDANARVITTADEMLQTLNAIKR
jgi:flagellar hook protein FlgE